MKLNKQIRLSTTFMANAQNSTNFNTFDFFFNKMNSMVLFSLKSHIAQKSEKNC